MENLRFKIAPSLDAEDTVRRVLPPGTEVTISCQSANQLRETLQTASRLAEQGYRVIPHLPARMIPSASFLPSALAGLTQSGIGRILVMAGGDEQNGPYAESLNLMEDISEFGGGSFRIGIVGHPETHPVIPNSALYDALLAKQHLASDLTAQLCFDATVLRHYLKRLRTDGINIPVWASAPSPLTAGEVTDAVSRLGAGVSLHRINRLGPLGRRSFKDGKFDLERFKLEIGPDFAGLHINSFNKLKDLPPSLMRINLTGATP